MKKMLKVETIELDAITDYALMDSEGKRVADTLGSDFGIDSENHANAYRLAACWNAFIGYARPELLEEFLLFVKTAIDDVEHANKEGVTRMAWEAVATNLLAAKDALAVMKGGA